MFSRGNYYEAEQLARSILERDKRQPVAYAVLGDLARVGGNKKEAIRLYSLALHYDPKNPVFQRRYSDLTEAPAMQVQIKEVPKQAVSAKSNPTMAPLVGLSLIVLACIYVVLAREQPIVPDLRFISTWTLGLIVMLFLSGVVMGASMAIDRMLETFGSVSRRDGKPSPAVALASVAFVSFWAAIVLYSVLGLVRRSFDISTSRVLAATVAGVCLLSLAAEASGNISGFQVAAWGGNLVYVGALCGWMVTDALRAAG